MKLLMEQWRKYLTEDGTTDSGRRNGHYSRDTRSEICFDGYANSTDPESGTQGRLAEEEEYVPEGQRLDFPAKYLESHMDEYRTEPRWKEFFKKSKEEQREWAETVDLSEPVEITVFLDGMFMHGDGHHRVMAAKLLGKDIPIIITRNHMKNKSEEGVWERWLELVQSGNNPKDLNPEEYNIKTMDALDYALGNK